MPLERLCPVDELADPGSREFAILRDGERLDLFLVRRDGILRAYRNRCPHTGVPLNWVPHQFLDLEGGFVQCATHGALFDIGDGRCLRGPCAGDHLEPLPLEVREGVLYLRL